MSDKTEIRAGFLGLPQAGWAALGSAGTICTLATLIFGVVQYAQSLEAERAKQTLEMVKEWRDDGYRASFLYLAEPTSVEMGKLDAEDIAYLEKNAEARRNVAAKIAKTVLSNTQDSEQALGDVVYFFNLLGLCVEARLCSEATAMGFFDSTVLDFFSVFESEIAARQSTQPDYAAGMTFLVDRFSQN